MLMLSDRKISLVHLALGLILLSLLGHVACARAAAETGQKVFATPEDAGSAMYAALGKNDRAELLTIFGNDSKGLMKSGDPVEDADEIKTFLKAYQQMHRFRVGPDGKLYLLVG